MPLIEAAHNGTLQLELSGGGSSGWDGVHLAYTVRSITPLCTNVISHHAEFWSHDRHYERRHTAARGHRAALRHHTGA
jgi:hypothetical protein